MGDNSRPPPATAYPAPVTGYPYPYPPPPPPQPGYNYNPNPYQYPGAALYRRLLAALIAVVIILGTAVFIVWLVLRPRLPGFRVDSVTVSNFNSSSSPSLITGNWDVRLTAGNPNTKIRLHYDEIEAAVFFKDEEIARNTLPPLDQGTKSQTELRATFAAVGTSVHDWVVDDISKGRSKGSVGFNLRLAAIVRFKAGFWRARRRWVRVYCGGLMVGLTASSGNASLVGGGQRGCTVGL